MKTWLISSLLMFGLTVWAETPPACGQIQMPTKVALLDFENRASVSSDASIIGGIKPQAIAAKGAFALTGLLANEPGFTLIDRRDFIGQMKDLKLKDEDKTTTLKPSFLRVAQALNADAVLQGCLLSYSPSKRVVDQGGYKTEFIVLTLRVTLRALDTRDGAVIAGSEGSASKDFRQSAVQQTVVGEDQLLGLLRNAIKKAIPGLNQALRARILRESSRPVVKLSVKTPVDPALVEIDGMLIGTTPLDNFHIYAGDHILTVGKAGYQDVTKQILLKADTSVEVPIFRTKLSAEEAKQILEKARINIVSGTLEPAVVIGAIDAETIK